MPKRESNNPLHAEAEQAVRSFFDRRRPRAYRMADLRLVLEKERSSWALPKDIGVSSLLSVLSGKGGLRKVTLRPEVEGYRNITRYTWEGCTPLEIASTLREKGYLTHGTAVFLHGLNEQVPRTLYVNYEQTPKPSPTNTMTQEGLARAFGGTQRLSRYTFVLEKSRFTILSGKNTKNYGIETVQGPSGEPLKVTGLERTLVDIVVRPAYAGGLYQVLEAYRGAREKNVSVARILASLRALDYRYPYHQAIGFLMERAGFEAEQLKHIRALGTDLNFYLGHGLKDPELDPSWRIFHPKGF